MLLSHILKCVLVLCLLNEIDCVDFSNKWKNVIDRSRVFYKTIFKPNLNLTEQSKQYNADDCYNDTISFYEGIDQSSQWAVRMYDSWGNSPSGILSGNMYNLGHFDECIDVDVNTQYCLLEIKIYNGNSSANLKERSLIVKPEILNFLHPIKVLVGTCYPSSCTPDLTAALYKIYLNLDEFDVLVEPSNIECHISDQNNGFEFTPMQIFTICLFSLIALLILSSTIVEFFIEIRETFVILKIWKAFSAYQNLPILCGSTQVGGKVNEIKFACLDGLRAMSIVWVAYGHSVVNTQRSPLINSKDIIAWSENMWTVISWATFNFAVDTFFVIGGFLATRSIKSQFEKDQRSYAYKFSSIPRMWFHRYIRLAPVVISAVLFFTTIGTQLGRGPFWNNTMREIELCHDNWWSTILFVQNYASAGKMCLGHLWYLAVDLQMFILTTILIFLIHWKGLRYLSIALVMILANIGNNIYWYVANDYQWVNSKEPEYNERNAVTYYPTHARMGSWIVGVILEIIYSKYSKKEVTIKISWKILFIGYVYCALTVGLIVANISYMTNSNIRAATVQNALFDSLSRVMWATMIAFIIFKCITRNGGPVDKLLSSPIWKPLAKLSFCIYVLHYVVQLLKIGQNRTMVYMDNFALIERFWSDFGISVTVSVLWTLAFEMPFRIIERINFNRPKELPMTTNQSHVNQGIQMES